MLPGWRVYIFLLLGKTSLTKHFSFLKGIVFLRLLEGLVHSICSNGGLYKIWLLCLQGLCRYALFNIEGTCILNVAILCRSWRHHLQEIVNGFTKTKNKYKEEHYYVHVHISSWERFTGYARYQFYISYKKIISCK